MASTPSPYVTPVERSEFDLAGRVLANAFYDSDQWAAVIPDPAARRRKLEEMFSGTLELTVAAHGVAERTEGMEAVAGWLSPGHEIGFAAMVRSRFTSARFALKPPFPNLRRMVGMLRQFDTTRKRLMPVDHWYLMMLGVEPRLQRYGYGALLVRHGIERADRDAMPIYLETEFGPNVEFYEKLGFEVIEKITIRAYDLPFAVLLRPPHRVDG